MKENTFIIQARFHRTQCYWRSL